MVVRKQDVRKQVAHKMDVELEHVLKQVVVR